jgi:hypothetical protein
MLNYSPSLAGKESDSMSMIRLVECAICSSPYSQMREHCPTCGARRIFIASHSYEPYRVILRARDGVELSREIVRAMSSTFCSDEQAVLQMPAEAE